MSTPALPPGTTSGEDRSSSPNVVEYAVQDLMKGKTPRAAALHTTKKLSGQDNFFLGPGVTTIDPKKLEAALWDRMAEFASKAAVRSKPGTEHYALQGTLSHFHQAKVGEMAKPADRSRLRTLVIEKLGRNPFTVDE
jgi:hypothetical protein